MLHVFVFICLDKNYCYTIEAVAKISDYMLDSSLIQLITTD